MNKMDYVQKTIEQLEFHRDRLAYELVETKNCIDVLRRQFDIPAGAGSEPPGDNGPVASESEPSTNQSGTGHTLPRNIPVTTGRFPGTIKTDLAISWKGDEKPASDPDCRQTGINGPQTPGGKVHKRKDATSEFPGVRRAKNYKDGRPCFEVGYKELKTKKRIYLGRSDNEYIAAAMYQEHIGNPQEAARLRSLVDEHKSLNPDKPLDKRRTKQKKAARIRSLGQEHNDLNTDKPADPGSKKYIWVCLRCGIKYRTEPGPDAILPCGHQDGVREVPADSQ